MDSLDRLKCNIAFNTIKSQGCSYVVIVRAIKQIIIILQTIVITHP